MSIKVDQLANLLTEILENQSSSVTINGDIEGKGIVWRGTSGPIKQLIYTNGKLFVTEDVEFAKGKGFISEGQKLLSGTELGHTVTKSNLQELGILKGLVVNGDVSIDNGVYYNSSNRKLGIGTNTPANTVNIVDTVDFQIGNGNVGVASNNDLKILAGGEVRITAKANGDLFLGNSTLSPVQVSVHGKVAIKVNNPDPDVDLHVNGSVKFNNKLQKYDRSTPTTGVYNRGDIIWNSEPVITSYIGWVCIQSGTPGTWAPFGKIGNS